MRKTVIAASAAAVLALSAACGTDENGVDVDGATDAVATEVDNLLGDEEGAEGAEGADAEGEDPEGADAEGAEGAEGEGDLGDIETAPVTLADGTEAELPAGIAAKYEEAAEQFPELGNPVGEAQAVAGGAVQEFDGGAIYQNPEGEAFVTQGEILAAYEEAGGPEGELGFPTSDETPDEVTGFTSTFENGTITFDDEGVHVEQN